MQVGLVTWISAEIPQYTIALEQYYKWNMSMLESKKQESQHVW